MNKTIIVILIVFIALSAGVGGAYAVSRVITDRQVEATGGLDEVQAEDGGLLCDTPGQKDPACRWTDSGKYPPGQLRKDWTRPGSRDWMGPGMMGRGGYARDLTEEGERISIDEAFEAAQAYALELAENLRVTEVMAFSENFYAVVVEEDTGKGALELLVHPYTGRVMPEPGPTRMWNAKYGHMKLRVDEKTTNTLSMVEAAAAAQVYLDEELSGAVLEADGIEFYGYYSFDYTVDGEVAGMLSVKASTGQVWPHTWHGTFIDEKEFDE